MKESFLPGFPSDKYITTAESKSVGSAVNNFSFICVRRVRLRSASHRKIGLLTNLGSKSLRDG